MRPVAPSATLIARTTLDTAGLEEFVSESGGMEWVDRLSDSDASDAELLVEAAGRTCYRSWAPGLNKNVTRVRTDSAAYLGNILGTRHGSVTEHASFTFAFRNVSRIFCYDADTEVLTSNGWKPWPKVDGSETFATLNPDTGTLEYQKATERFEGDYAGPMYRVKSEQVDLLVTPQHRMWIRRHDTQAAKRGEQKFGVELAHEIAGRRVHYQKTAIWVGQEDGLVHLPGTTRVFQRKDRECSTVRPYGGVSFPIIPFARFLGHYLAEGSLSRHQIVIAQNRGSKLDAMAANIREMGLSTYIPTTGPGCVRTQCIALRDFLAGQGQVAHEKRIPAIVQEWGPIAIRAFLEAYADGDGSRRKDGNHTVLYTTSPEMADALQVLAIKAGWSANVRVDDRTGLRREMATGQVFFNQRPCYTVSIVKTRVYPLVNHNGAKNDTMIDYDGKVYCVKVPNGLLFVRRNGKPVVSGNTHELVRHRAGVAISQESLRYVRLDDLPIWTPEWAREDQELMERSRALLKHMEAHQAWMAEHFGLDEPGVDFAEKKHKTSYMRRFAPEGVATTIVWTANVRALRWAIELRTSPAAEEEIRLVFGHVADIMQHEAPHLFGDFERSEDGTWTPTNEKI